MKNQVLVVKICAYLRRRAGLLNNKLITFVNNNKKERNGSQGIRKKVERNGQTGIWPSAATPPP